MPQRPKEPFILSNKKVIRVLLIAISQALVMVPLSFILIHLGASEEVFFPLAIASCMIPLALIVVIPLLILFQRKKKSAEYEKELASYQQKKDNYLKNVSSIISLAKGTITTEEAEFCLEYFDEFSGYPKGLLLGEMETLEKFLSISNKLGFEVDMKKLKAEIARLTDIITRNRQLSEYDLSDEWVKIVEDIFEKLKHLTQSQISQ